MQKTQIVTVRTPYALVIEIGRREVMSAWWMRRVEGRDGLEAFISPDRMVRLELVEDEPAERRAVA